MLSSWSSPPSQEARGVANMYFFRFHALQLLSYKSAALDAAWKCPLSSSRFMKMMRISMTSKRGENDNSTGIGSRARQDQGIKLLVYASDPLPVPPTHLPWVRACKLSPLSPLCPQHTWPHMPSSPSCTPSTSLQTQTSSAWSWIFSLIPVFVGPQAILMLDHNFSYRQSQIWAVKDDTEAESMLPQSGVSCSVRSAAWVPMSVNFLDLEKLSARHHYL